MAGEFTQFFTGGGFDGFANKPQVNGNNILYRLQVELKDILLGGENKINITANFKCEICDGTGSKTFDDPVKCQTCQGKGQISKVTNTILGQMMSSSTCPTCQGLGLMPANPCDNCRGKSRLNQTKQFNIKVPKGVNESEQIELTGEGEAGIYNGLAGNLYIEFHIIPDKVFVRDKNNLHCMVQVPFTKSLLGDKANIKTYYGDLEFFIKPNSQRGDTIKIHHYGVPINANSDKKGDLIIHLEISYPHKLNHKQRQIMSEFAKTLNNSETKIEVLDGTTSFS
ncbi:MAG: J domain-containing protein [Bifidobacteriaceae bacterium]|nr:J domain-containing protein [Bifidobacteriaceae bacterium]